MKKTACIVTGGTIASGFLKRHMEQNTYQLLIAVDGALAVVKEAGLIPDYIVGDFDTVEKKLLLCYNEKSILRHPPEKDQTDTELAIDVAVREGCNEIAFLGATGTRLDHSLANLFLLQQLLEYGVVGIVYDEYNKLYLKNRSFTIRRETAYGNYVSLLPLTDNVTGVTLTGMKYPVDDRIFYRKYTLGVSNEITEEEATVEFSGGIFIVVETQDERKE
ncbi:MAG: thiamine diphosphokinase [Lachnospiraceae bacterium]